MKATGIVRRIDDLGRVVIPKEIRRTMRIREGDPLEIFTNHDGEVIFKKYSPIGELNDFARQYAESLHKTVDLDIIITDRDGIIACSGVPKRDFQDKKLSSEIENIIEERTFYMFSDGDEKLRATEDSASEFFILCAMPIISEGDVTGCVASMLKTGEKPQIDIQIQKQLVTTAANFLSKQLEN